MSGLDPVDDRDRVEDCDISSRPVTLGREGLSLDDGNDFVPHAAKRMKCRTGASGRIEGYLGCLEVESDRGEREEIFRARLVSPASA
jgi:hypothetical protein